MQTKFKINYSWKSYLLFLIFYFIFLYIFLVLSGGFCNLSNFGHQDFAALTLRETYVSLLYIVSVRSGPIGMISEQLLDSQPPYMTTILHVRGTYIYILPPHTGT
jgi:hypothetical protein